METKRYALILILITLALVIYLAARKINWESVVTRLFGKLNIKRGKPNNFKIREKINEHMDKEGVISTSLFGSSSKYTGPLLNSNVYKPRNWYIRIYLCPDLLDKYREEFLKRDYEIFVMDSSSEKLSGTIWRFLPMEEGTKFLSLDADDFENSSSFTMTLPSKNLFDKWEKSGAPFVIFGSSLCSPMMAGKWGAHYNFPDLTKTLERYDFTKRGSDEVFLKKYIYPIARKKGFLRLTKGIEKFLLLLFERNDGTERLKS